eukprot:g348.t1
MDYSFHKNENSQVGATQLYGKFGPFTNRKQLPRAHEDVVVSKSKHPYLLRCLYHEENEEGEMVFVLPKVHEDFFICREAQYDTTFDRYEKISFGNTVVNSAISINQKSYVCMICVNNIRHWLRNNKKIFYKMLKKVENCSVDHPYMHGIKDTNDLEAKKLFEKVDNFMFSGNFVFDGTDPKPKDRVSYLLHTMTCGLCEQLAKDCECQKTTDIGVISNFQHDNESIQASIIDYNSSNDVHNSKKRKKSKSNEQYYNAIKKDNDWKNGSLWHVATTLFCEFFSLCSATTNNRNGVDNTISLKESCELWLPYFDDLNDDGLNHIHVRHLLKSYLVLRAQVKENFNHTDESDDDDFMEDYLFGSGQSMNV